MLSKSKQKLGKPIVVRLEHSQKQEVESIAAANNLTVSDIMRVALRTQLREIRSGRLKFQSH